MKKILVIAFSFLYLLSSAGVQIDIHYCGNKIQSISFFQPDEKDCCGKGMKKKDCCKDDVISYKIKENQSSTKVFTLEKPAKKIVQFDVEKDACNFLFCFKRIIAPDFHAPPNPIFSELYLKNCVFRI